MATTAAGRDRVARLLSHSPDLYERVLALASLIMLVAVTAAIGRGWAEWGRVPAFVWVHLATVVAALALTPMLLLQRRGTARHRQLGWAWSAAMVATALASLFVTESNPGHFSPIHALSVLTLAGVPALAWAARRHKVRLHRFGVRATVTGALLIAGFFTFPFGRMLGRWLTG